MNPGPPTQPLLWDILIRSRVASVYIVGDVTKAFLQIELHEDDRDAFRFIYGLRNERERKFRSKRLPFGGESSPFVLGGVIQYHLEVADGDEKVKQDLKDNTYVDNVMGPVSSEVEAEKFKVESTEIMAKRKLPLGKYKSNINVLNDNDKVETSFWRFYGINVMIYMLLK